MGGRGALVIEFVGLVAVLGLPFHIAVRDHDLAPTHGVERGVGAGLSNGNKKRPKGQPEHRFHEGVYIA
jgi:hypothetical protein